MTIVLEMILVLKETMKAYTQTYARTLLTQIAEGTKPGYFSNKNEIFKGSLIIGSLSLFETTVHKCYVFCYKLISFKLILLTIVESFIP